MRATPSASSRGTPSRALDAEGTWLGRGRIRDARAALHAFHLAWGALALGCLSKTKPLHPFIVD